MEQEDLTRRKWYIPAFLYQIKQILKYVYGDVYTRQHINKLCVCVCVRACVCVEKRLFSIVKSEESRTGGKVEQSRGSSIMH